MLSRAWWELAKAIVRVFRLRRILLPTTCSIVRQLPPRGTNTASRANNLAIGAVIERFVRADTVPLIVVWFPSLLSTSLKSINSRKVSLLFESTHIDALGYVAFVITLAIHIKCTSSGRIAHVLLEQVKHVFEPCTTGISVRMYANLHSKLSIRPCLHQSYPYSYMSRTQTAPRDDVLQMADRRQTELMP